MKSDGTMGHARERRGHDQRLCLPECRGLRPRRPPSVRTHASEQLGAARRGGVEAIAAEATAAATLAADMKGPRVGTAPGPAAGSRPAAPCRHANITSPA